MAVRFHDLTITNVSRETADAISITFDVPEELHPTFLYKSGQYITIRVFVDGVEHRRNYSLCSSPADDEPMRIAVKRVHMGAVSQWLNEHAAPGVHIEVYPPMGNFTKELDPTHSRHYVMVAGGSGITPILSIIKSVLRVEPLSVVSLIYANRNVESIIFDAEITSIAAKSNNRLRVFHVLENAPSDGRAATVGTMNAETARSIITTVAPSFDSVDAFVCGPSGMMDNVINVLHSAGLSDAHIHREYFALDKQMDSSTSTPVSSEASGVETESAEIITRTVRIRLYGEEHTFEVQPDETILSAAQRADLDPPFACQIGACCTCRAKIVSGKVVMDEREALSDDEIDEGYALTCQSHPLTDNVFADYDQ